MMRNNMGLEPQLEIKSAMTMTASTHTTKEEMEERNRKNKYIKIEPEVMDMDPLLPSPINSTTVFITGRIVLNSLDPFKSKFILFVLIPE